MEVIKPYFMKYHKPVHTVICITLMNKVLIKYVPFQLNNLNSKKKDNPLQTIPVVAACCAALL